MSSGADGPEDVHPDPTPDSDLPSPKQSTTVRLSDGRERSFPSLQDYIDQLVEQGIVSGLEDLIANKSQLIGELFINWVSTAQVSCLFAAKLASNPRINGWVPAVQLNALARGESLPTLLSEQLDAIGEKHEAAILIFPDITTPEQIVTLLNLLCGDPAARWYRTSEAPCDSDSHGLVELRWVLPSGKSVNYVLGFAPFDAMPITRRSPFTALFLRVKDHKREGDAREDDRVVVHLADLDSKLPQVLHNILWEKSKESKILFVEPTMRFAARAKVTFNLPLASAEKLCKPRAVTIIPNTQPGK